MLDIIYNMRYTSNMTKRLAVIDGKSVFYRGYYAMPGLALPDGTPTGGVYGFASLAIELIKKLEPDYVAVAWDKRGTNIRKRKEIYPEYKAGRKPAPDDFYAQIPILYDLLEAFGWPLYELDDYEADDILGTFAAQAAEKGIQTDLITSDLDALQIIGPTVKVYAMKSGLSNIEEFHEESFEKKYGLKVEQFLDLKSLMGDSSDNLPGVPGVGQKTAIQLLQQYQTLDGVYEHLDDIKPTVAKKLVAGKELAYMSKEVGRIWCDAPVELDWDKADINDTNLDQVALILKRLQFTSLINRLPKHMQFHHLNIETEELKKEIEGLKVVDWPKTLTIDGPVMAHIDGDEIWLATNNQTVHYAKINSLDKSVWRVLELATIVAYDGKQLYHDLAAHDIFVKFSGLHDIRQAAFLLDPLARDRSITGLAEVDELKQTCEVLAALWVIYEHQMAKFDADEELARIAHDYDFPLVYILFLIEHRGVKIDTELLGHMSAELGDELQGIEQEIYKMVGYEFNIASPIQLSEVLFTKLQLPTKDIKKGKTAYSTGQKELDKLRGQHPIIELIERSRELSKLKSTYIDALPKLVDEHSRVHTTFNQDVAATGRLSSTNPNMQNIPIRTELGRRIREAFIPEGDKVLVGADYSQFELRLAAALAGDKEMINDFNGNVDIHTKTASIVYNVPIDDVTKTQRRNAKVINFGVLYGMSPHGLSVATGMSMVEAKKFIDEYFELRAPIRLFIDETINKARRDNYVETFYGRRRPTPDVHSSNFIVRSAAERAAANMPIQGTEADLMKRAMIQLEERLDGLGEMILQVHDSILVECPAEHAEQVSDVLRETLENIAPELNIKLQVDIHVGKDWSEL